MITAPCYRRIAFLIVLLSLATTLPAQQDEKQEIALTIDPIRMTLNAGKPKNSLPISTAHQHRPRLFGRFLTGRRTSAASVRTEFLLPGPWAFIM
jgi:hypothetical protein